MKTLKILGCIALILLGISVIFIGAIMCDLGTKYETTTFMLLLFGFIFAAVGSMGLFSILS
jgi:hypothetical protein